MQSSFAEVFSNFLINRNKTDSLPGDNAQDSTLKRHDFIDSQEVRKGDRASLLANISHTTHQVHFKKSVHL
jgi:hypothetical protein